MWEILTKQEITEIWSRSGGSSGRVAYAMGILLGRGVVERIASGIYLIQDEAKIIHSKSTHMPSDSILRKNPQSRRTSSPAPLPKELTEAYWQVIAKLIQMHAPSGGVIGWEKALEIHLSNYSIPDILIIYTRDTAIRIKLSDGREVHFRTLTSGPKTGRKNLWRTIVDHAIEINPPTPLDRGVRNWFQICGRELALLEALSLRRHDAGVEEANISRFFRSFAASIDRDILGDLTRLRYIRPLNRLRVLARDMGYTELYAMTLEIIRDEGGGCYLNL